MYTFRKNTATTQMFSFSKSADRKPSISIISLFSCFNLLLLTSSLHVSAATQQECEIIAFEMISHGTHIESTDMAGYRQLLESECSPTIKESVVIIISDPPSARKPLKSYINTLNKSDSLDAYSNNKFEKLTLGSVDTTPPELVSLNILQQTVNVTSGETSVEVAISLKDESGIDDGGFWFRRPDYGLFKSGKLNSPAWIYNSATDTYDNTYTFVFDANDVEGTWEFSSSLSIIDSIGNRTSSYDSAAKISALGFDPNLDVINSNIVDTLPPELVSLNILQQTVNVTSGETSVEVAISLKDESGIDDGGFWFRRPDYGLFKSGKLNSPAWIYNSATDTYDNTYTFAFDENDVEGTWEFSSSLSIVDSIGNRTSSYDSAAKISALGFDPNLDVINNNIVDTLPPELVSLNILQQTVNVTSGETSVEVAISLKDESGIDDGGFWFRRPDYGLFKSGKLNSPAWIYNSATDTYDNTYTFVFEENDVEGTWEFSSSLSIVDSIGNRTSSYDSAAKITAVGFVPFLTVINGDSPALIDSRIEPVLDYSKISTTQVSEFKLFIENQEEYELTVIANDSTSLSKVDFFEATSTASSCQTLSNKISCTFSAIPVSDYMTARISSEAANAANFGLVVFLNPTGDSLESDWSSNSVNYPQTDIDGDGIANTDDSDADGDGVANVADAFPFDSSESIDTDLDGIGNNGDEDDDNDGINDNIDNNPLVFDEAAPTLYSGQLSVLSDMTDDSILDLGILKVDSEAGQIQLNVLDGKDQNLMKTLIWTDSFVDTTLSLHLIPDMNDNGVDEVGLFGIQESANNAGKPQMFVRDLQTGNRVNVYNWPANWKEVSALVLDDISGDGIAEIAIQGRFKEGSRPQLVVRNGDNGSSQGTFSYPNLFNSPIFYQHSDVDGDGFAEISTFGRITRNNKIQVKITNGVDSGDRMKAYNFPDKWANISWHRLDDSNDDGEYDWGMFGINKADGRPQLIVKNGTDPRGALRIHAWPAMMQDAQFYQIPDINNDGVDEVAAAGRRSNNGRYQFQIQDGTDRNVVMANYNLNLTLTDVSYHVLPDLSGDEKVEIGFMGINAQGEYELIIQHGDTLNGEYTRHNLGNDWQSTPTITSLGDTDDDDLPDLLVYGQNASGEQLVIEFL